MEAVVGHIRQYFGAFEHVFHELASPDIHVDICVVTPSALCCWWPPAIARALLKNAPIVLLDEATASLDVENETKVQGALSRLLAGKTVLVIAHRMRTVAGADHIVVLENGRVPRPAPPMELAPGPAVRPCRNGRTPRHPPQELHRLNHLDFLYRCAIFPKACYNGSNA